MIEPRIAHLAILLLALSALIPALIGDESGANKKTLDVILLLADDMNYDSPGFMGCKVPEIVPNLDRFAASGMVFTHCYNACATCGSSRSARRTGMYPQSNGCLGHNNKVPVWWEKTNADRKVTSMVNLLGEHGYFTARICKSGYRFNKFDGFLDVRDSGNGRDPIQYHEYTERLIEKAHSQGKPFFLNINSQDPHEYKAGYPHETAQWTKVMMGEGRRAKEGFKLYANGKPYPEPSRIYSADEISVPSGYHDGPELREDIKHNYSSVRRLDDTVDQVQQALDESGEAENTLVIFWSDHGIGWPYAKSSDYPNSTRTPLVVRWPGRIAAGQVDHEHVASTTASNSSRTKPAMDPLVACSLDARAGSYAELRGRLTNSTGCRTHKVVMLRFRKQIG